MMSTRSSRWPVARSSTVKRLGEVYEPMSVSLLMWMAPNRMTYLQAYLVSATSSSMRWSMAS